ncbi:hypothetical protein [Phocaeicola plebeius]|uniref:hypothetical protein n=1 Tax=Phocaeicola plebeius TaxID=310297 RepID=UPI0026F0E5B9|nr:hypothetical protein [Phocaeicola plebeius]
METLNPICHVFQTDSEIVNKIYQEQDNYLIEYDKQGDKEWCAIYFCSNDIYYPNTEEIFQKRIIDKNFFEWYHSRVNKAYKHIFIRDIFKQWYLAGINKTINTPEKLIDFLRIETKNYKVITIGSSAGGYAAILYGSFINTQYALTFNPQFELQSLIKKSSETINPLLFRIKDERIRYFDITKYINIHTKIYYFYSNASSWDIEQNNYIRHTHLNIIPIIFNSNHHGIPFLKIAIPTVINLNITQLEKISSKKQNPILFTIRMVGIRKTILGLYKQIIAAYKKRK